MSLKLEDKDSEFKLAQLLSAFESKLDVKLVEKILESPGDINYQVSGGRSYFEGCTALHLSKRYSEADELKIVQLLLKYGADFTIKSAKGQTVLHQVLKKIGSLEFNTFWGLQYKLSDDVVNAILSAHVQKSISENPANEYGLTHFHMACMADHVLAAQFFLDNGVPIDLAVDKNARIFPGCIPLFIAAKSCAVEVVKVLLQYGANVNDKDEEGLSLLSWLIECNIRIVDSLMIENVKVDREKWLSKLKINQKLVKFLLNCKIDGALFVDDIGLSDLQIACTLENVSLVERLLIQVLPIDHQVDGKSEFWPGYTAMHFAAYFDFQTTKLLLNMGANLLIKNADGLTPFDICLERYGIKEIHSIMSTQPSWNDITLQDGKTKLLDLVSAMLDIETFRSFLDRHIDDINTCVGKDSPLWPGYTVLHLAVLLSEQPKNISLYGSSKATYISSIGETCDVVKFVPNLELIEECLNRGADVTVTDVLGSTPLHLAFYNRQTITIEKLLRFHHMTVNPIDRYSVSHLHIACASQNTKVMKILVESGANIEQRVASDFKFYRRETDSNWLTVEPILSGFTCLHIAVVGESTEVVVEFLTENGADVNAIDDFGATPIHCCLMRALEDPDNITSEILLSSGNLKEVVAGDSGLTHLHVASCLYDPYDHTAVKRLLDLGADIEARFGCQSVLNDFNNRYGNGGRPPKNFEHFAGLTPLQLNIMNEPTEVAYVLINQGADFLTMAPCGQIPLISIFDCEQQNDCVKLVLAMFGKNEALAKRAEKEYGLTVLHLASSIADRKIVEKLIAEGANVNAQINKKALERSGYTPLHMVLSIYSKWVCKKESSWLILEDDRSGILKDILETTRMLLAGGADVNLCSTYGDSPLHLIIDYSSEHELFASFILNLMLNSIEDFNINPVGESSWSHFHIACYLKNLVVIEEFLKHGVDVNAPLNYFRGRTPGCSPLHLLISQPHENMAPLKMETIDILLKYDADVKAQDANGDTVLHRIVRFRASNRVSIARRIIRAGADLNKLNKTCETPFTTLLLTKTATTAMISLFIENGCLVNYFNVAHQRGCLSLPLCVNSSVFRNRAKILEVLFKSSDITKADNRGRTAVHNIVSAAGFDLSNNVSVEEYNQLIRKLCREGCDIDSQDKSGATALHIATQFKNNKAIAALLMNGADVNLFDDSGSTAFNYSFVYCECKETRLRHRHSNIMKTFYIHMKKLIHLKLNINEFNKSILSSNLSWDFNEDGMAKFHSELNEVRAFKFEEESNSFSLNDLLSETGVLAIYPQKLLVRMLVDKFYRTIDDYLKDYGEVIGLVELQVRKAVKRISLINKAAESLNCLLGFPFPDICRDLVFRCLSNDDFENVIFATNFP